MCDGKASSPCLCRATTNTHTTQTHLAPSQRLDPDLLYTALYNVHAFGGHAVARRHRSGQGSRSYQRYLQKTTPKTGGITQSKKYRVLYMGLHIMPLYNRGTRAVSKSLPSSDPSSHVENTPPSLSEFRVLEPSLPASYMNNRDIRTAVPKRPHARRAPPHPPFGNRPKRPLSKPGLPGKHRSTEAGLFADPPHLNSALADLVG